MGSHKAVPRRCPPNIYLLPTIQEGFFPRSAVQVAPGKFVLLSSHPNGDYESLKAVEAIFAHGKVTFALWSDRWDFHRRHHKPPRRAARAFRRIELAPTLLPNGDSLHVGEGHAFAARTDHVTASEMLRFLYILFY